MEEVGSGAAFRACPRPQQASFHQCEFIVRGGQGRGQVTGLLLGGAAPLLQLCPGNQIRPGVKHATPKLAVRRARTGNPPPGKSDCAKPQQRGCLLHRQEDWRAGFAVRVRVDRRRGGHAGAARALHICAAAIGRLDCGGTRHAIAAGDELPSCDACLVP